MRYGKFVAVTLALALSPIMARAEGKIAIGPQGGLTFPNYNIKDNTASQYGNRNGWMGGVFLEFGLWSVTLRPELNYVTHGYSVANLANVDSHYLEVPVLLKINPLSGFAVSPFIVVGPQWSKQLSSSVALQNGTTTYTDTVTNWDFSGVAGLGVDFNILENLGLELQGRYNYGFRNLSTTATTINERGFTVIAGLSIQNAF